MIYINLLDYRDIYKKITIKKQLVFALCLLLLTFITMSYLTYLQKKNIGNLNQTISRKQIELDELKVKVKQVTEFEKKEKKLKEILKVISILKLNQSAASLLLNELNNLITDEVWITKMEESNKNISLNGYSFSNPGIASFMKQLESSNYFNNIELIGSEQSKIGNDKVKKFTIRFNVNVNSLKK